MRRSDLHLRGCLLASSVWLGSWASGWEQGTLGQSVWWGKSGIPQTSITTSLLSPEVNFWCIRWEMSFTKEWGHLQNVLDIPRTAAENRILSIVILNPWVFAADRVRGVARPLPLSHASLQPQLSPVSLDKQFFPDPLPSLFTQTMAFVTKNKVRSWWQMIFHAVKTSGCWMYDIFSLKACLYSLGDSETSIRNGSVGTVSPNLFRNGSVVTQGTVWDGTEFLGCQLLFWEPVVGLSSLLPTLSLVQSITGSCWFYLLNSSRTLWLFSLPMSVN